MRYVLESGVLYLVDDLVKHLIRKRPANPRDIIKLACDALEQVSVQWWQRRVESWVSVGIHPVSDWVWTHLVLSVRRCMWKEAQAMEGAMAAKVKMCENKEKVAICI